MVATAAADARSDTRILLYIQFALFCIRIIGGRSNVNMMAVYIIYQVQLHP